MKETVDPVMVYLEGFLATFGNNCGKRLHEIAGTIGFRSRYRTRITLRSFTGRGQPI